MFFYCPGIQQKVFLTFDTALHIYWIKEFCNDNDFLRAELDRAKMTARLAKLAWLFS